MFIFFSKKIAWYFLLIKIDDILILWCIFRDIIIIFFFMFLKRQINGVKYQKEEVKFGFS